jgi:hypothetical protein
MRKVLIAATISILFAACKKEKAEAPITAQPEMMYKNLQNSEVKYQQAKGVDIDNDGANDFWFAVQLVGDAVLERDRLQFLVNSGIKRNLLNDANDESPMLNKSDVISKVHPGYQWWEISWIILAEKITDYNGSYWQGKWKNADHKYLPVQLEKNGNLYHGWIELSFNSTTEKLILHNAALSKEADKSVKAGW